MALQLCRALYFTQDIRMGRASGGHQATRSSVMLETGLHEPYVEIGIEAVIFDPRRHTRVHVAWHMVKDFEIDSEAREADAKFAKEGPGETRADKAKKEAAKAAERAQAETAKNAADANRAAEAEARAKAKASAQAGA